VDGSSKTARVLAGRIADRTVVGNVIADHEEIDGFNGPDSPNSVQQSPFTR
jgi:hypothetical protein